MEHKVYCVISFENVCPYALKVTFDDGTSQVIDFRPVLAGEIYGPLQDEKFFNYENECSLNLQSSPTIQIFPVIDLVWVNYIWLHDESGWIHFGTARNRGVGQLLPLHWHPGKCKRPPIRGYFRRDRIDRNQPLSSLMATSGRWFPASCRKHIMHGNLNVTALNLWKNFLKRSGPMSTRRISGLSVNSSIEKEEVKTRPEDGETIGYYSHFPSILF
jgi:hypothetical protein